MENYQVNQTQTNTQGVNNTGFIQPQVMPVTSPYQSSQAQPYVDTSKYLPTAYPSNYYVQQPCNNAQQVSPTASAVNIQIFNPTANTGSPSAQGIPVSQPIYTQAPASAPVQQPPAAAPVAQQQPPAAAPVAQEQPKAEEKSNEKTKDIVELTDQYIQTLENYLRNPSKDIRIMGAKELVKRFSEDESRKNDAALNALLNLTLQDSSSEVRTLGFAMLNGGVAQGDNNTVQLLQNLQNSSGDFGQDAISANQALLKMSGKTVKVPDNSPDKTEKKTESK